MRLGNPAHVYSTALSKTAKDKPIEGEPAVPGGLTVVPADHWLTVAKGDVLLGFFKDPDGRDVVALASHNAYQSQAAELRLNASIKRASLFDRAKRKWKPLRVERGRLTVEVAVSATELLRVSR